MYTVEIRHIKFVLSPAPFFRTKSLVNKNVPSGMHFVESGKGLQILAVLHLVGTQLDPLDEANIHAAKRMDTLKPLIMYRMYTGGYRKTPHTVCSLSSTETPGRTASRTKVFHQACVLLTKDSRSLWFCFWHDPKSTLLGNPTYMPQSKFVWSLWNFCQRAAIECSLAKTTTHRLSSLQKQYKCYHKGLCSWQRTSDPCGHLLGKACVNAASNASQNASYIPL